VVLERACVRPEVLSSKHRHADAERAEGLPAPRRRDGASSRRFGARADCRRL